MIPKWQTGVIVSITEEAPATRRFKIAMPELERFDFVPGQFVTLDLPISDQRNKRWRSYSIASAPDGTNEFELLIVLVPDGSGTHYLFENMTPGATLTLRGPMGSFTLPPVLDKDLYLICTGTGIAPFHSMVQHIFSSHIAHKNIYLIFGTRTSHELLYAPELRALEAKMAGFYYIPTLSREQWSGHTGYVHTVYESMCRDKPAAVFMLCGWKKMVDEAILRIQQLGYDRKEIREELYG